jgi:hypothetical protein
MAALARDTPAASLGVLRPVSRGMAPAFTVINNAFGPGAAASSSFAFTTCGAKRRLNPTMRSGPPPLPAVAWYASSTRSSPSPVMASGFSTKTCFPASSAWTVRRAWVSCGVAPTTTLVSASANRPSLSVVVSSNPYFVPMWTPLVPALVAMLRRRAPPAVKPGTSIREA